MNFYKYMSDCGLYELRYLKEIGLRVENEGEFLDD